MLDRLKFLERLVKSFYGSVQQAIDLRNLKGTFNVEHLTILLALIESLEYLISKGSLDDESVVETLEKQFEDLVNQCQDVCKYLEQDITLPTTGNNLSVTFNDVEIFEGNTNGTIRILFLNGFGGQSNFDIISKTDNKIVLQEKLK